MLYIYYLAFVVSSLSSQWKRLPMTRKTKAWVGSQIAQCLVHTYPHLRERGEGERSKQNKEREIGGERQREMLNGYCYCSFTIKPQLIQNYHRLIVTLTDIRLNNSIIIDTLIQRPRPHDPLPRQRTTHPSRIWEYHDIIGVPTVAWRGGPEGQVSGGLTP